MSPRARRIGALVLLIFCVINAPLSFLTYARDEQPTILLLSWGAMVLTAVDILATTDVREKEE
jgi:hypothetical protein